MPHAMPKCARGKPPIVRLALAREKCPRGVPDKVSTANDAVGFLQKEYGCQAQEWVVAIGLGNQNQVLGVLEVGLGGISQAMVDPRVLFAGLLLMGAGAFILAHNHPSGDSTPSQADVELTRQVKAGSQALGIRMLDHLVISGHNASTSFVARGLL